MLENNLKSWRHKHEMNQTEFAEWLGVGKKLYNRWENQKVQPSLLMALKLSIKLECTVNDLFEIIE
jgi:DNA-binding XRE family transcriptional regulator